MKKLQPDCEVQGTNFTVGDFWAWAYSDILSNTNRSVFAEFLVGGALGILNNSRIEWNAYDFIYRNHPIEVKCSAYLQSWPQKGLSKIRFDIGQKLAWDAATNTYSANPLRSAHIYIFCLFIEQDRSALNVLDTAKWHFHVLKTADLEKQFPQQKTLNLATLERLCSTISYSELRPVVDNLVQSLDSTS